MNDKHESENMMYLSHLRPYQTFDVDISVDTKNTFMVTATIFMSETIKVLSFRIFVCTL